MGPSKTLHRYSPNDLSSELSTCLIWIFSLASWLMGGLVEGAEEEEEDRVIGLWTEDTTCIPVAEQRLNVSRVLKLCL